MTTSKVGNRNSTSALVVDIRRASSGKPALPSPKELTADERELWLSVLATRSPSEWRAADAVLLRAYVKAWSDVALIQKRIDDSDFVSGLKCNPLMLALNYRLVHMSTLYVRLGLTFSNGRTTAEKNVIGRHRKAVAAATSGQDDDLLARSE